MARDELQAAVGDDRHARREAAIGIDAARHVQADRRRNAHCSFDQRRCRPSERARQDPEQRIDDGSASLKAASPRRRRPPRQCVAHSGRGRSRVPIARSRARCGRPPAHAARARSHRRRCCPGRRPPPADARAASAATRSARLACPARAIRARRHRHRRATPQASRRTAWRCRAVEAGCASGDSRTEPYCTHADRPSDPPRWRARIRTLATRPGSSGSGIAGVELGDDVAHQRDWLAQASTGRWTGWRAMANCANNSLQPGAGRTLGGVGRPRHGQDGRRPGPARTTANAPAWPAMRWVAITTSSCDTACNASRMRWRRPSGRSAIACSSIPAPVLERALARNAGLAGSASTAV